MKHKRTLIFLLITLAIAFAVLVFVSLFSVKDIDVNYSVYGENEYDCSKILAPFKGKNLLFLDENDVKKELEKQTVLKIDKVEKVYPSTIKVSVSSRQERFSILDKGGGYFVVDDEYAVVGKRADIKNHTDKLENILVRFELSYDLKFSIRDNLDFSDFVLLSFKTVVDNFDSPRDEIKEIYIYETQEKGNIRITITMREGVKIILYKATERTQEKIVKAINKLAGLEDTDKLSGEIISLERESGEIFATYTAK